MLTPRTEGPFSWMSLASSPEFGTASGVSGVLTGGSFRVVGPPSNILSGGIHRSVGPSLMLYRNSGLSAVEWRLERCGMRGRRTKSRTAAAGDFLLKNPSTHDDRRRACVRAWSLVIIITVTCRYFRSYYVRSMYVVVYMFDQKNINFLHCVPT